MRRGERGLKVSCRQSDLGHLKEHTLRGIEPSFRLYLVPLNSRYAFLNEDLARSLNGCIKHHSVN